MPVFGLGLHFLIALACAVHAMRNGREMYWLIILFTFPLLGSAVYILAVVMPRSRLERKMAKAGTAMIRSLDPERDVRAAQQAFDLAPTAQHQMALAAALSAAQRFAEAAAVYDACLSGPFARDPDIRFGAAQAWLSAGNGARAVALARELCKEHPAYHPARARLLLARAYALAGMHDDAGQAFKALVAQWPTIEGRAEYAFWAIGQGHRELALDEIAQLEHARKHMPVHARELHGDLFRRVQLAQAQLKAGAG